MDTDELIDEPGVERFKRTAIRGAFAFLACALAALGIPCLFGQAPLWFVAAFFIALALWCVGLRWAMLKLYARGAVVMASLLQESAPGPAPKKKRAKRGLPKHITIPNFNGYQVRVVRDGVEYSKSFPWSAGGKALALLDAVAWRDRLLRTLPEPGNAKGGFRSKPLSNKTSWDRVGVVRTVGCDRRRSLTVQYVRFSVSWVDTVGKARVKTFQAGRADSITRADEVHTSLTAEAFRSEWEFCQSTGERFEPWRYDSWRKDRLYPFDPADRVRRDAPSAQAPQPATHVPAAQPSASSQWIASVNQDATHAG